MSSWSVLGAMVLVTCVGAEAGAWDGDVPGGGWRTLPVGTLPVHAYATTGADPFGEAAEVRRLREQAGPWLRQVEDAIARRDLVALTRASQIAERLSGRAGYRETAALAAERFALGREHYRRLELEAALRHLDRAARLYADAHADVVEPRAVADVSLYRGLALVERGEREQAHMAFRAMWLVDPHRRFESGYYPEPVERALGAALEDLGSLPSKAAARYPSRLLVDLARKAAVDVWVQTLLLDGGDGPRLRVILFDARTGMRSMEVTLPLDGPEGLVHEGLDRALSGWQACATELLDRPYVARPRRRAWYVDLGYTQSLMLKHDRTREGFASPGGTVGVTWQASPVVQLYMQTSHTTAVPDVNRDLLESFGTTRMAWGAGLTGGSRRVRAFVRAGLEGALSHGDIAMTRDVLCKHFTDGPADLDPSQNPCNPSHVFTVDAPAFWFGITFGVGARWLFQGDWYAVGVADMTTYVASRDLVGELNFPVSGSLGVGRRF